MKKITKRISCYFGSARLTFGEDIPHVRSYNAKALTERIVNDVQPLLGVALLQSKDTKMQQNALAENGGGYLGSDAAAMVITVLEQ